MKNRILAFSIPYTKHHAIFFEEVGDKFAQAGFPIQCEVREYHQDSVLEFYTIPELEELAHEFVETISKRNSTDQIEIKFHKFMKLNSTLFLTSPDESTRKLIEAYLSRK